MRLQQSPSATPAGTYHSAQTAVAFQPRMQVSAGADDSVSSQKSPQLTCSTNTDMNEVDTCEDAIDGMGAIKFTHEQHSG